VSLVGVWSFVCRCMCGFDRLYWLVDLLIALRLVVRCVLFFILLFALGVYLIVYSIMLGVCVEYCGHGWLTWEFSDFVFFSLDEALLGMGVSFGKGTLLELGRFVCCALVF